MALTALRALTILAALLAAVQFTLASLYCWRAGKRHRAAAALLEAIVADLVTEGVVVEVHRFDADPS